MIIGKSTLKVSQATVVAALQFYFESKLFAASAAPKVVSVDSVTTGPSYGNSMPDFSVELDQQEPQS